MSTRSTIRVGTIPLIGDFHIYRNYGRIFIEFGEPYSDSTFELFPRFLRRRFRNGQER
jgi:hypothetical protein